MSKYVAISEAARILGVAPVTLRRWDASGRLPATRLPSGHRRWLVSDLTGEKEDGSITMAYARVSSRDQREDLARQVEVLELHCASKGWEYELVQDLGSGMSYHKKGLKRLLDQILEGKVDRLVLTHKDRLLRFGAELIFSICEAKGTEVVILNKGQDSTFEEDLAQDVLEIITVFSARLYGSRSHKNKKLIEGVKRLAQDPPGP